MKNSLCTLSKNELLEKTKLLVAEERRITLELIEHLREIEKRMLFLEMGYGSLHEFAIQCLGLSGGSAHRRISTMRLIRDLPDVKEKVASGELSVTNAAKIENSFRAVSKIQNEDRVSLSVLEKKTIIQNCLSSTQVGCESKLMEALPALAQTKKYTEKVRLITPQTVEIKLIIPKALQEKIEKLNLLESHANPNQSYIQLFERLIDRALEKKMKGRTCLEQGPAVNPTVGEDESKNSSILPNLAKVTQLKPESRFIPKSIKNEFFLKAGNQCEIEGCNSRYQLEIDHRIPRSMGGKTELDNLRVLCKKHNLFEAVQTLGEGKMKPFLQRKR